MGRKILSIEVLRNAVLGEDVEYNTYDGYKIVVEGGEILVVIHNAQQCCENWGYMISEDDIERFIGATIFDLYLTDTALNTININTLITDLDGYANVQFVNFDTDRGLLQLVVYNSHNGYYGHEILVIDSDEILLKDFL